MLKLINAWCARRPHHRGEPVAVFDEQLLADLGLTWEDVSDARAQRPGRPSEGAVFP